MRHTSHLIKPLKIKSVILDNEYWDRPARKLHVERIIQASINERQFDALEAVFGPGSYNFSFENAEECEGEVGWIG